MSYRSFLFGVITGATVALSFATATRIMASTELLPWTDLLCLVAVILIGAVAAGFTLRQGRPAERKRPRVVWRVWMIGATITCLALLCVHTAGWSLMDWGLGGTAADTLINEDLLDGWDALPR